MRQRAGDLHLPLFQLPQAPIRFDIQMHVAQNRPQAFVLDRESPAVILRFNDPSPAREGGASAN